VGIWETNWCYQHTDFLTSNCIFRQFLSFCKQRVRMSKKVVFLGTGGTIAGSAASSSDNVSYKAAQLGIQDLLDTSQDLQRSLAGCFAQAEQVFQINSKDLGFGHWSLLLGRLQFHLVRPDVVGVVVTHGTDTLEETAYFLHRVLPMAQLTHKPIVLTCAMRPASSSQADGPANLADATAVATSGKVSGVVVVCAGKVHAGALVRKVQPYRVDAFDSGDAAPVAYVEEGRVRLVSQSEPLGLQPILAAALHGTLLPRVEIVTSHSGAGGAMVLDMVRAMDTSTDPLRGIVVAGTGNGSIHFEMERALRVAVGRGVWVWRTSRCAGGAVVDASAGIPEEFPSVGLSPVKARIEMQLQLMSTAP
jgi:L-asparaginase